MSPSVPMTKSEIEQCNQTSVWMLVEFELNNSSMLMAITADQLDHPKEAKSFFVGETVTFRIQGESVMAKVCYISKHLRGIEMKHIDLVADLRRTTNCLILSTSPVVKNHTTDMFGNNLTTQQQQAASGGHGGVVANERMQIRAMMESVISQHNSIGSILEGLEAKTAILANNVEGMLSSETRNNTTSIPTPTEDALNDDELVHRAAMNLMLLSGVAVDEQMLNVSEVDVPNVPRTFKRKPRKACAKQSNNKTKSYHGKAKKALLNKNRNVPKNNTEVSVGPNSTIFYQHTLDAIDFTNYKTATRKLLRAQFTREILASHSLSGKPSPAFAGRPVKARLNPIIVEDIIHYISERCEACPMDVRQSITTKCADENKMLRQRQKKLKKAMEALEMAKVNAPNDTSDCIAETRESKVPDVIEYPSSPESVMECESLQTDICMTIE